MTEIKWSLKTYKINELTDYYKNPRQLTEKQFNQLKKSIDKFGMIDKPIINADAKNTIIGGHQRLNVLRAGESESVECWVPDHELDEKEVEELNIRLNKNTGEWDFDVLANEFQLDDLLDWGFDKGELDLDLWAGDAPEDVEPQIDKAEELRVKWGVESGQLWQLGEHRIICGDCTDRAVVERVMGGEKAQVVFTDPPYGISREGIANDELQGDEFDQFNAKWMGEIQIGKNAHFICYHSTRTFPSALIQAMSYGWKFERMLWFYRPDKFPAHSWKHWMMVSQAIMLFSMGDPEYLEISPADQDTYRCTVKDLGDASGHPTEKIVEQSESVMKHLAGDLVYEPFSGSGTTLIACERLGRKCRAVEISPAYCAVAIQRWVDVTGGKPEVVQ